MKTRQYNTGVGVVVGALLIVLGLVFFLSTTGAFGLDWGNSWPMFLTVTGLCFVAAAIASNRASRPGLVTVGTMLILLSMFYFATTLEMGITWDDQGTLWPMYVIVFGIGLLAGYVASDWERVSFLITGGAMTLLGLVVLVLVRAGLLYPFFENFPVRLTFLDDWGWSGFAGTWWPVAVIAVGLVLLAGAIMTTLPITRGGLVMVGSLLLMIGIFFLVTTTGMLSWSDQGKLWPIYPIIFGLALLASYLAAPRARRL